MTSYWKPRWDHPVLFGFHQELAYRIDLIPGPEPAFVVRLDSGPGFHLELELDHPPAGFRVAGEIPEAARKVWLDRPECREAIAALFRLHFSRIIVEPDSIALFCRPANEDVLPEGAQLSWCLGQAWRLWSYAPVNDRRWRRQDQFMA